MDRFDLEGELRQIVADDDVDALLLIIDRYVEDDRHRSGSAPAVVLARKVEELRERVRSLQAELRQARQYREES